MAFHVNQSCYCCLCGQPSAKMDIDAALDELGMLSTVTESRKQYLQERNRTRSESSLIRLSQSQSSSSVSNQSVYKIVHIDPKFVTGFSDSLKIKDTPVFPQSESSSKPLHDEVFTDVGKDYRKPPDAFESEIEHKRKLRMRSTNIAARNRRLFARARKPYEIPSRLSQSFQESDLVACRERAVVPDIKSKSNSSSPVKSFSEESITRSRSLDHLDFSALHVSDRFQSKEDIDRVASDMKKLHVTDDS